MNEVGLNARWIGKDMTDPETQQFTKDVLNHMRERLVMYQEQYGDLYNLEATPAAVSYTHLLSDWSLRHISGKLIIDLMQR